MTDRWLVDTNVLLRFVKRDDRDYALVYSALSHRWRSGADLLYTTQNLRAKTTLLFTAKWRRIIVPHTVSGIQVHDALAAAMLVHRIPHILTLDKERLRTLHRHHARPPR